MNVQLTPEQIGDTVRNHFDFEVVKLPLFAPDNLHTGVMGLFRNDNGKFVGGNSKSKSYTPHTSEDVAVLAESASKAFNNEVKINCHWRDGHYVKVTPPDSYRRSIFGTSDNIFPHLMIEAGYNDRPFIASLALGRDVCRNLQIFHTTDINLSVRIRHTQSLRDKMDDLVLEMSGLREGWEDLTQMVRRMESRKVALADFLNEVYKQPPTDASDLAVKNHRKRTEAIFDRVMRERRKTGRDPLTRDYIVSAWEAYNAVQGYTQHDKNRRNNPSDFDRVLLASRDIDVRKAEELALSV